MAEPWSSTSNEDKHQKIKTMMLSRLYGFSHDSGKKESVPIDRAKQDFQSMSAQVKNAISLKGPRIDSQKTYSFGLTHKQDQSQSSNRVWELEDSPLKNIPKTEEVKVNSIASKELVLSKNIEIPASEIEIFKDFKPLVIKDLPKFEVELPDLNLERIGWEEASLIVGGKFFNQEIAEPIIPVSKEEIPKKTVLEKTDLPIDGKIMEFLESGDSKNNQKLGEFIREIDQDISRLPKLTPKTKMLYQFLKEYQKARTPKPVPKPKKKTPVNQPKQGEVKTKVMTTGWSSSTKPALLNARYAPTDQEKKNDRKINAMNTPHFLTGTTSSNKKTILKEKTSSGSGVWIGGKNHEADFQDESWVSLNKY